MYYKCNLKDYKQKHQEAVLKIHVKNKIFVKKKLSVEKCNLKSCP